jgi:hypothetical protein
VSTSREYPGTSTPTAHHSLRLRLPLLISALIVAVMAVFLGVAYQEVEASLVRAAGERVRGAAEQVVSLLARSTGQSGGQLQRAAANADVRLTLKEIRPAEDLPRLLEYAAHYPVLPGEDIQQKPFTADGLMRRVREVLDR